MDKNITISNARTQQEKNFWDARNRQVFDLIAAGKSPKEVAIMTGIQEKTVYTAIANKFFEKQMKAHINAKLYEFQIHKKCARIACLRSSSRTSVYNIL